MDLKSQNYLDYIITHIRGCLKSLFLCHVECSSCGMKHLSMHSKPRFYSPPGICSANTPSHCATNDILYLLKLFKHPLRTISRLSLKLQDINNCDFNNKSDYKAFFKELAKIAICARLRRFKRVKRWVTWVFTVPSVI